ncbi:MAG TPA: methyltransferase domain-containing protein [Pirellulales bacterium]|nr:methyltransferase domain-containing protein [Pirellulales bacterium]
MQHQGYVQYGCGLSAPESWTNFDASPTLRLQRIPIAGSLLTRRGPKFPKNVRYGDIVRGLPIEPGSCNAIYCSHVLEHLSLEDLRIALRHTYRYLKPGGVFRFVLPDLEHLARQYLASTAAQPAIQFMEDAHLGCQHRARGLGGMAREWLGNSRHLWMWDYRSLVPELERAGFQAIHRAAFGDSSDPHFRDIEDEGRWTGCLGVECRRPA